MPVKKVVKKNRGYPWDRDHIYFYVALKRDKEKIVKRANNFDKKIREIVFGQMNASEKITRIIRGKR